MGLGMKVYRLSKAVPLETLIRAYELYSSTDMSKTEVAKVLGLNKRTLTSTLQKAEADGLWVERAIGGASQMVLNYLNANPGKTCAQIAKATGLEAGALKKRVFHMYKRGKLRRIKPKGKPYRYYEV